MEFKDRVCCICNEHKKFLSRVNTGQKLYCMQCQAKITKEYGKNYWKPCSFSDFLESVSSLHKHKDDGPPSMFKSIRRTLQEIEKERKG
jgi:hypothetical protein